MNHEHDELPAALDALLCDVVTGDRSVDDAQVVAASQSSTVFAARLRELVTTQRMLQSTGDDQRTTTRRSPTRTL